MARGSPGRRTALAIAAGLLLAPVTGSRAQGVDLQGLVDLGLGILRDREDGERRRLDSGRDGDSRGGDWRVAQDDLRRPRIEGDDYEWRREEDAARRRAAEQSLRPQGDGRRAAEVGRRRVEEDRGGRRERRRERRRED